MSDYKDEGGSLWDKISRARKITCSACGCDNSPDAEYCEDCQALLTEEDDEEHFEAVVGEDRSAKAVQTHIEVEELLAALRRCYEGVMSSSMNLDSYMDAITALVATSEGALAFYESDDVSRRTAFLEAQDLELLQNTQEQFRRFSDGVQRMASYLDNGEIQTLKNGFVTADDALKQIAGLQDSALAIIGAPA